jgi:hypothetical protein
MRFLLTAIVCIAAVSTTQAATLAQVPAPAPSPLVLVGGTVVDVSNWGHSARDIADAVVIVEGSRIVQVGTRAEIPIPKNARVLDCTGKYIIPGLIDGYAGMNSQGQANAFLYMGVTTVVASSSSKNGLINFNAYPRPHLYLLDSVGTTDNWSLLIGQREWSGKLHEGSHPVELTPDDTAKQINATAKLGTRVLLLGGDLTAANTQWIITRAHQLGMATYGEFISTPYRVAVEHGVDVLMHMGRYELGVIPDELQRPLVDDPNGSAASTAYGYAQQLPPTDPHLRDYARFLAAQHAALMPTFSQYFVHLPGHRNLWREPAAVLLNPERMYQPSDRVTGEAIYPLVGWQRRLPQSAQRWMLDNQRKKTDQNALKLWNINATIFAAGQHYLAASGAPVSGSMPGISLHTELEMMVRLGLSPREALAAATNNYALQLGWTELGEISPGRRADILVVEADPTVSAWNVRRIWALIFDGNPIDREALLNPRH